MGGPGVQVLLLRHPGQVISRMEGAQPVRYLAQSGCTDGPVPSEEWSMLGSQALAGVCSSTSITSRTLSDTTSTCISWTSLSHTGPSEGTLQVFPNVRLSNAYVMLRPFFGLKSTAPKNSLLAEDWEVNLESTAFPGSDMGRGQELNDETHPHLRLNETMTSMPRVKPGDQVSAALSLFVASRGLPWLTAVCLLVMLCAGLLVQRCDPRGREDARWKE